MSKRSQSTPEGYARFGEALKLFSPLTKGVFTYRVQVGDILVDGHEDGKLYNIESIRAVRAEILAELKKKAPPPPITDWTKIGDVPAALKLDYILYHEEYLATSDHYQERKTKNPRTSIAVFDAQDRGTMYAYISLLPMKEETIMDILFGRMDETEVTSKHILTYDEPGAYDLLVSSAAHHPDHPEYIRRLIHAYMQFWIDQYPERRIRRIYAQAVSDDGRRMVNELRMGPMYAMNNGRMDKVKDAYVLDLEEPAGSRIIQKFQGLLKAKESDSI